VDYRTVLNVNLLVNVIRVCRKGKVVNTLRLKVPAALFVFSNAHFFNTAIAKTHFIRILKHTSSTDEVVAMCINGYVEIPPHTVKFATNVLIRVPAVFIVLSKLRVPLSHGKIDALFIITPRTTNLLWHLSLPGQFKRGRTARKHRLSKICFKHRSAYRPRHLYAILGKHLNVLVANLIFTQSINAVLNAAVRILDRAAADIHHTFRLECIEV